MKQVLFIKLLFLHNICHCYAEVPVFSSCQYDSGQIWRKGSGPPVKSWLQSIVELVRLVKSQIVSCYLVLAALCTFQ